MDSLLANLTPSQRRAVTTVDGPLLVLAGPGSGKTRVITHRVAYLLRSGVPPWNVLCLTFTNKAAGEMRKRVEELVGPSRAWLSTFHAFASRMLRRDLDFDGYTRDFTIYDRTDQLACLRGVLRELSLDPVEAGLRRLPGKVSRAKATLAEGRALPSRGKARDFRRIFEAYGEALRRNNALDFDDLLLLLLRMLRENEDVRRRYQERFAYILVDEYQDTNRLQYEIVRLLAEGRGNLCVTGDPDQSIYRWRGADLRNILDFRKDYPGAETVLLEESFRSHAGILEAAGRLIACNEAREEKNLLPVREEGRRPWILQAFDPEDEALQVADEIARLLHQGTAPSDVAVFYRTNAQSRTLESALLDQSIPYVVVGTVEFFQRREIKDVLSYLRAAFHPRDDVAFLRILNVPPRGIGPKSLELLRSRARRDGLALSEAAAALAHDEEVTPRLRRGLEEVTGILAAARDYRGGVEGLVAHVLRLSVYRKHLEKTAGESLPERQENLDELLRACADWDEKNPASGPVAFLEEISLVSDVDRWDRSRAVSLMTLHASKGLEFSAVAMVGLEEGLLPHFGPTADEDPERVEEERRLCFVGMTRAKDRLLLSWAKNRRSHGGGVHFGRPSRFLAEAGLAENLETRFASRLSAGGGPKRAGAAPRSSPDPAQPFRTGDAVQHQAFGRGRVVALKGMGEAARVLVDFPGRGLKTFAVNLAPLFRVSPEEV